MRLPFENLKAPLLGHFAENDKSVILKGGGDLEGQVEVCAGKNNESFTFIRRSIDGLGGVDHPKAADKSRENHYLFS